MKTFEDCKDLIFGTCGNVSSWLGVEFEELLGLAFEAWLETRDKADESGYASYFGQRVKWTAYRLHRDRHKYNLRYYFRDDLDEAYCTHSPGVIGKLLKNETTDAQILVRLMLDCADELRSLRGSYHIPKKNRLRARAIELLGWDEQRYDTAFAEVQARLA